MGLPGAAFGSFIRPRICFQRILILSILQGRAFRPLLYCLGISSLHSKPCFNNQWSWFDAVFSTGISEEKTSAELSASVSAVVSEFQA